MKVHLDKKTERPVKAVYCKSNNGLYLPHLDAKKSIGISKEGFGVLVDVPFDEMTKGDFDYVFFYEGDEITITL